MEDQISVEPKITVLLELYELKCILDGLNQVNCEWSRCLDLEGLKERLKQLDGRASKAVAVAREKPIANLASGMLDEPNENANGAIQAQSCF